MPGPPKKLTKRKILEGNPGKTRLNTSEPKPQLGAPIKPAWFDDEASRFWDSVVPELLRMDVLSKIDGPALEGACQSYSTAIECRKILMNEGLTMRVGNGGYEQQRPEVSIEQKAWNQVRQFCAEFGLTPASRGRIQIGKDDKQETGDSLLNGRWKPSVAPTKNKTRQTSGLPVLGEPCEPSGGVLQ